MGFDVGKAFSSAGGFVKQSVTDTGHFINDTTHSIGHSLSKGTSKVYGDVTGAIGYTGKHVIGDVDTLSNSFASMLNSPMLFIAVAVVGIVLIQKL